jgi:hypothetical protein
MGHPRRDPSSRCGLARAVATHLVRTDVTGPTAAHRNPSAQPRPVKLAAAERQRSCRRPAAR